MMNCRLRLVSLVLLTGSATGCVKRYNSPYPAVTPQDLQSADRFPIAADNKSLAAVNETYTRTDAKCTKVQGAMQAETDGIETRNLAIGASFAAVAAGLATASGIYTASKGDQADPTVSSVLALGAGATVAPTFFYFGSDERASVVKERITKVEERRKTTSEAWRSVKSAQTAATQANFALSEAAKALATKCSSAPPPPECAALSDAVERRKTERQAALARAWEAIDSLDDAVRELGLACR